MTRPAEKAGGLTGLVTLIAIQLGASESLTTILVAATAVVPGAVTWVVSNGGCQGVYERLRYGRRP